MVDQEHVSAEDLLNLILDEVDDIIIINDADRNIVWMNSSAVRKFGITAEESIGMKCYKLLGATCCCDRCCANLVIGGPQRCGCRFKEKGRGEGEFECSPIPYCKDGKLKAVIQHIKVCNKNE